LIREITEEELLTETIPFNLVLFKGYDSTFTIRDPADRHTTVIQRFRHEGLEISVKSFFMDWFYYGFPKNMMKTASDYFSDAQPFELNFEGNRYNAFFGDDYRNRKTICAYIDGICIEVRVEKGDPELAKNIFKNAKKVKTTNLMSFMERSFYATYRGPYTWFEDERIGRLSWKPLEAENIGEFSPDSVGNLPGLHKLSIFVNKRNEYLWLDVAVRGKGLRNLSYRFNFSGSIFKERVKMNRWRVGILSQHGPAIMVMENPFFRYIMSLPNIEPGDLWKYVDIMENLNIDPFMP
jgi:hypothetical protein